MNQKAQAGLEYLMTYGWALVMVSAIIGALILITTHTTNTTTFSSSNPTKIMLKGSSITENTAELLLQNITGGAIKINSVHFFGDLETGSDFKVNGAIPAFPIDITAGGEMHFDGLASQNNCGSGGSIFVLYSDAFNFERTVEIKCNGGATSSVLNACDYTTWTLGQGSVGGFSKNGTDTENWRIMGEDPWGKTTIVWEARPDDAGNASGGWNYYLPIDNTKLYRFSVWVNRTVLGANGRFYFGTTGYGAVYGVTRLSDETIQTNPYFYTSSSPPSSTQLPEGEWVLVVGHVFPHTHTENLNHPDSGRYTLSGRLGNIANDYKWLPGTTGSRHRTYLYYATDISARQQWVYPRVDVIDGTEPSINELLNGFDSFIT